MNKINIAELKYIRYNHKLLAWLLSVYGLIITILTVLCYNSDKIVLSTCIGVVIVSVYFFGYADGITRSLSK